jgi:hypothetical protein
MCAWVKLDDGFTDHERVLGLSDPAFRLLVTALVWCNARLTDGFVAEAQVPRLVTMRRPMTIVSELLAAGVWHRSMNACGHCLELRKAKGVTAPVPRGGYLVHDYLDYQRPAWAIKDERDKARARMQEFRSAARSGVRSSERSGERSPEQVAGSDERSAERSGEVQGEVRASPVTRVPSPEYPRKEEPSAAHEEPDIPDRPAATDRKPISGTRTNGLQPLSTLDGVVASARERVAHG